MAKDKQGCVQPAKGPIGQAETEASSYAGKAVKQEESKMIARVGQPAPDFEATAYVDGEFKNIKLSDHHGQWVVLCFYPGDFTFV